MNVLMAKCRRYFKKKLSLYIEKVLTINILLEISADQKSLARKPMHERINEALLLFMKLSFYILILEMQPMVTLGTDLVYQKGSDIHHIIRNWRPIRINRHIRNALSNTWTTFSLMNLSSNSWMEKTQLAVLDKSRWDFSVTVFLYALSGWFSP